MHDASSPWPSCHGSGAAECSQPSQDNNRHVVPGRVGAGEDRLPAKKIAVHKLRRRTKK